MIGHAGNILYVNLTDRTVDKIPTEAYSEWVGGQGLASALIFDLIDDWSTGPYDPENVYTIMSSPLGGLPVPQGPGGRTNHNFIGAQPYPTEWYTRSGMGGRLGGMLKMAGYDGIAIQGSANDPVWINIIDNEVTIENADDLWGLDTYETQAQIWSRLHESSSNWERHNNSSRSSQRSAIATIGPGGENLSRNAAIIHESGSGAGQGGGGAVWGSKNLKAISVLGTGAVEIANPGELIESRKWMIENYGYDVESPETLGDRQIPREARQLDRHPASHAIGVAGIQSGLGCMGCHASCRSRTETGKGRGSQCVDVGAGVIDKEGTEELNRDSDNVQKYGINAWTASDLGYLYSLYQLGFFGEDGEMNPDLPWNEYGDASFAEEVYEKIANREGIGDDLAEGMVRAAKEWGRLEQDLATGELAYENWGYSSHYDNRAFTSTWGYPSILTSRDVNQHLFVYDLWWMPYNWEIEGESPPVSASESAELIQNKTLPHEVMPDYSTSAIYGQNGIETTDWILQYSRFWTNSVQFCSQALPDLINGHAENYDGATPEIEPRFFNAVTDEDLTFEDGMEIGDRILHLDRAIWTLQGRHRDQEVFPDYIYEVENRQGPFPVQTDDGWEYEYIERSLDRSQVEEWKTEFYEYKGWDVDTGRPTRESLEEHDLGYVADKLEEKDVLPR
ncbi:hypothetical protein K0C01_10485 [Salinarchaeum sp. IM2453]|uniref:aldehyde ferredoxin oxidoreductase N-terminal domain-containing protein n=1 Tax=Salinarchaeum sp. IM2453 TaxID=2862870 RepID=UPI001C82F3D7|nr:aldehyde ferredoxin oxidoreductase N-terminal domain-containing protein [Salinarchaeum sp. IM2453]QZA88204.1 hypothetical protein K0C01_10485 [Salinarchaeum sp. IM2453]